MELTETMRAAGSTRTFRPDPVSLELIYGVLDDARFAPSGGNRQGWRVIVVTDPALRTGLRDLYLKSWQTYHAPLFQRSAPAPSDRYAEVLDQVPVHLIVLTDWLAAPASPDLGFHPRVVPEISLGVSTDSTPCRVVCMCAGQRISGFLWCSERSRTAPFRDIRGPSVS